VTPSCHPWTKICAVTAIVDRRQILDFRLAGHNLSLPAASLGVAAGACGLQDTPPGSAVQGLHAWVPDASPDDVDGAIAETKELIVVVGGLRSRASSPSSTGTA
jgi:hypothetical protein